MNKLIKAISTGVITAVVTLFALLFSGLGTNTLLNSEGNLVSMTTVSLGVNEFGLSMILVVLATTTIASYIFSAMDKKN